MSYSFQDLDEEALIFDIFGVTVLLLVAALGTWLALRARRAQNLGVKWTGLVLSSVVTVASTVALGVTLVGFYRITFPPSRRTVTSVKVAGTPDQIARGARFGTFCAQCHSPDGQAPLVGRNFALGGPPFGTLWAPNLTPAGEVGNWSDAEVIRAIREGVHQSGRALVVMPSEIFRHLSDVDVEAIVAYLRSQPAVGPNTPPTRLNILAGFLFGVGIAASSAQPPITRPIIARGRRLNRARQVPRLDLGLPGVPLGESHRRQERWARPSRRAQPHGVPDEVEFGGLHPYLAHGGRPLQAHPHRRDALEGHFSLRQ